MQSNLCLKYCALMIVAASLGCEQATEMMSSPPPVSTPPVTQSQVAPKPVEVVQAEPEPVATPIVEQTPKVMPVETPPPVLAPQFGGVIQRLVTPEVDRGKRGAEFTLVMKIEGEGLDIYQFEVDIRDQSGASMTFPVKLTDGSIFLKEFVPGAGVQEKFEFQVLYLDPETRTRTALQEDKWGHFSVDGE